MPKTLHFHFRFRVFGKWVRLGQYLGNYHYADFSYHNDVYCHIRRQAWQDGVPQHNARPARPRSRTKPMFLVSARTCPKTDGLRPQRWLLLMSVIIRHYCQHAEYWAQHYNNNYNNDNNDNTHFNGQTWVGQRQTVKPFWILLLQDMRYLYFSFWSRVSGVITPRRPRGIEYCGCVSLCFFMLIFNVLLICVQNVWI